MVQTNLELYLSIIPFLTAEVFNAQVGEGDKTPNGHLNRLK